VPLADVMMRDQTLIPVTMDQEESRCGSRSTR
jgi:hypothetical protein